LRRAVELAPRNSIAQMTLGLIVAAQPGRLDEAAAHLRRAIELDPSNAEARQHLGRIEQLRR
jgi:Flp pilus assembly protein TadD